MMRAFKRKSLLGQIMMWVLIPLVILWPISFLISAHMGRNIANVPFDQTLKNSVQNLSQQLQSSFAERSLSAWGLSIPYSDEHDQVYYQIMSLGAETLVGTTSMPQPDAPIVFNEVQFYDGVVYGEPVRIAYMWMNMGGQSTLNTRFKNHPILLIQVAETLKKREILANQILKGVTLPQLVFVPLTLLLIWFGLTRGLARLNRLKKQMAERDSLDLSDLTTHDAPVELQPLVEGFNEVLSRLRRHIALQKRFLTDTAHQIKTPLAGLQMHADFALQTNDPDKQRQSLMNIAASSERTARLVNQLIALSHTEHLAEEKIELNTIDLTTIVRQQTIFAADRAIAKGLHLALEVPDTAIWIKGHAMMLGELVKNLVDNAIQYTHSVVTVRITHDSQVATLSVLDDGPGISVDEREQIFAPFHSILGIQSNGSGLGLAIAQQVADLHHTQIHVMDNPELVHDQTGTLFQAQFTIYHA